jgi:putative intracellular protease/amidase
MHVETVHLFLLDRLADWEAGFAIAHINSPQWQRRPGSFRVCTVGLGRALVVSQGGVTMLPDTLLDDLSPAESSMLILPGSPAWEEGRCEPAVAKAKEFLRAGVPVAAICGATFALAKGGVLDERRHTSGAPQYLASTGYRGGHLYQEQLAVTDGNLITAGPTAALEFAREILAKLEVYEPDVLDAWYGLHKTGDPSFFFALEQATGKAA